MSSRTTHALAGLTVVIAATLTVAPIANAAPAPKPSGETKPKADDQFADSSRTVVTRDGWKVVVTKTMEALRSVPPLNRSPQSFEAFSTIGGEATVSVADPTKKPKSKVKSAVLTTGLQVGCAVTADSLTVGGSISNATNVGVTPSVTANLTGTATGQGGTTGGSGGGSVSAGVTPGISATIGDTLTETGSISGVLKPGTTKDIPYAKKSLEGPDAATYTREVRVAVDNCIGGVQVRSYATIALQTDRTDDSITTYGKPIFITRP
ncbi:MspA family porin [Tsukamurella paurometabola]|uniref:MspA n=1 Tax=Tsukamurella paurometabola TaxID=2061 RepID=A0A3P8MBC7_TSUPA|nr:MspA family porin [Tsukamurella paurometabola]UEA85168.1 MspA family porin [Tsukamurella paurometabola]VDR37776.1 MspA [Tsukamurella paurometabola]